MGQRVAGDSGARGYSRHLRHQQALLPYQGKRISEIAKEWHEDAIDTILDFLIKDHAATGVAVFGMSEPDVALVLRQP